MAAIACSLAGLEMYALWRSNQRYLAPPPIASETATRSPTANAAQPSALPPGIIGFVDEPVHESTVGATLKANGWALAPSGIRDVQIRIDGRSYAAQYGASRADVAAVKPGYPDAAQSGFTFEHSLTDLPPARHVAEFVASDKAGNSTALGRRSIIPPQAQSMWAPMLDVQPPLKQNKFYYLMMLSGVATGGAAELDTEYRDYASTTQIVGMEVPILYLRTTRGAKADWQFDPDFDTTRKCGERLVAEDNLSSVIAYAIRKRIPVQFILNGGIWSDSSCATPQWDLTDHLEEDVANCQWTQSDHVFPDDYLKGLTGSVDSPELARSLTYNVYAKKVRAYKKRNLQAAARIIASFAREHPDLFVGVALDSDTYMNPFFLFKEIFDYNPGMLRQFREWLRGSGPYAGQPADGAPDLSRYRRIRPLTLAQVNALAKQHWKTWDQVQPPRRFPGMVRDPLKPGETPFWEDPWWQAWDQFRKHIVGLHYDELSHWVHEAGIPTDRIFSAQGFIKPDPGLTPFATHIDSHSQNYDSSGVSIEGSIPRYGHLGAVIYGEAARNDVRMDDGHSMFAEFARMNDGWAIVEYNSTDLKHPTDLPDYAMAYKTFRDAFNFGAREISMMAWNGSNGINAGKPGYVAYMAWRNTPPEEAMRDHIVSHANVPWGARLWTFGTPRHVDDDGWSAARGEITAGGGTLTMRPDSNVVTLLSPGDQVIRPANIERLLLRWEGDARPAKVSVAAQIDPDGPWIDVGSASGQVALKWPAKWMREDTIVQRIKLEVTFPPEVRSATLSRVLLYPRVTTEKRGPATGG
ncbi:MAG TPA: hypothetical protein VMV45_13855 [Casimicrobiaceae bacterium]|nr:hypothetical protein [Casimicrobiaceae bacterium]